MNESAKLTSTDDTTVLTVLDQLSHGAIVELTPEILLASVYFGIVDYCGGAIYDTCMSSLAKVWSDEEIAALKNEVGVLDTAHHQPEYADSSVYAKAILNALPAFDTMREKYDPAILRTPSYHHWYYEIGYVLLNWGVAISKLLTPPLSIDHAKAIRWTESYWRPFLDPEIVVRVRGERPRDILSELEGLPSRVSTHRDIVFELGVMYREENDVAGLERCQKVATREYSDDPHLHLLC